MAAALFFETKVDCARIPIGALKILAPSGWIVIAGMAIDNEATLVFSVLENIRPMIETVPLEQAADAYARMMQGKARFRMVLVTKHGVAPKCADQLSI